MKIATYNTWKNEGDYPKRLRAMETLIRAADPDILLLQEVIRVEQLNYHTARVLSQELGLYCHYAPSRTKYRLFGSESFLSSGGLAVLSKFPALDTITVELPASEQGGNRITQYVHYRWQGIEFVIANTHLTHLRQELELKKRQWTQSVEIGVRQWGQLPLIIGGDFNSDLDDPETHKWISISDLHLLDLAAPAWEHTQESTRHPFTFPVPPREARKAQRIDSIFMACDRTQHRTPFTVKKAEFSGLEKCPFNGVFPSDHALVIVDLQPA